MISRYVACAQSLHYGMTGMPLRGVCVFDLWIEFVLWDPQVARRPRMDHLNQRDIEISSMIALSLTWKQLSVVFSRTSYWGMGYGVQAAAAGTWTDLSGASVLGTGLGVVLGPFRSVRLNPLTRTSRFNARRQPTFGGLVRSPSEYATLTISLPVFFSIATEDLIHSRCSPMVLLTNGHCIKHCQSRREIETAS